MRRKTNETASFDFPADSSGDHGFYSNGGFFLTLDVPGARNTFGQGVSGNSVVGYYYDSNNVEHGFETTVPEPASAALWGAGVGAVALGLLARRRRPTA